MGVTLQPRMIVDSAIRAKNSSIGPIQSIDFCDRRLTGILGPFSVSGSGTRVEQSSCQIRDRRHTHHRIAILFRISSEPRPDFLDPLHSPRSMRGFFCPAVPNSGPARTVVG